MEELIRHALVAGLEHLFALKEVPKDPNETRMMICTAIFLSWGLEILISACVLFIVVAPTSSLVSFVLLLGLCCTFVLKLVWLVKRPSFNSFSAGFLGLAVFYVCGLLALLFFQAMPLLVVLIAAGIPLLGIGLVRDLIVLRAYSFIKTDWFDQVWRAFAPGSRIRTRE